MTFTEQQREEIAKILENIAEEGMEHPRNLDAALDAIQCIVYDNVAKSS